MNVTATLFLITKLQKKKVFVHGDTGIPKIRSDEVGTG